MGDKTKRPTAQDYHAIRRYLTFGFRKSVALTLNDPGEYRSAGDTLAHLLGVIDRAEQQAADVPEVEAPEDAGDDPDDFASVDDTPQPPTDPEARVRAMSDEEVEAGLTERGVGAWMKMFSTSPYMHRAAGHGWTVISEDGGLWQKGASLRMGGGNTTSEAGRAECSRRLLAHLLRAEEG